MKLDITYETGVIWQDFQHKQLIDLFEKIKKARSDEKEKDLYPYTTAFLAMYVNHHFSLEEEYMAKYDYPDTQVHTREHTAFVKELKTFRNAHREYSPEAVDDLLTRVKEWILSHIMENDQKLGKFILSKEHADK
ncbi:MAG: hemerythrin family protein [Desulfobacteraceae bacterium]|nr:hemerythrin family protein [Desulfobacteraceae bacterium]